MSLENIAAGLFNFDPVRGLQAGTSMGAQMMEIALRSQQQQIDAGQAWDQAALSADRNALSRRTQMFNEMTQNLNRFDEQAKQRSAEEWALGAAGGSSGASVGVSGGGEGGVNYADLPVSSPLPSAEGRSFSFSEPTALPDGGGFNTEPAVAPTAPPPQDQSITSNVETTIPIGGVAPGAPPNQFVTAPDAAMSGEVSPQNVGGRTIRMSAKQPSQDQAVSFSGGPAITPNVASVPGQSPGNHVPAVPIVDGAHRMRADVAFDGRPANVRYNNPGAAYPRPRDNAFGLEGYGVIGGGHLIGKYPTPVHGAASNMDLFSKSYKGMTVGAAVRKWRGGNGSLNVPAGYKPGQVIDDKFVNDKGTMTDFFGKMAAHESSKFSMPPEQWEQAFDMYSAGGAQQGEAQPPVRTADVAEVQGSGGGIDAGLFPPSTQPSQAQAQQFYGPQGEQSPTASPAPPAQGQTQAMDLEAFPEYRAVQESRQAYQSTLKENFQNAAKLSELRTRMMQVNAEIESTKGEAAARTMGMSATDSNRIAAIRLAPLLREQQQLGAGILAGEEKRKEIAGRLSKLEKSSNDADAAWKIVQDRQRNFRTVIPEATGNVDPEQVIDSYMTASPIDRVKIESRFVNDSEMMKRIGIAKDYMSSSSGGDEKNQVKVGNSTYSKEELARFYDPANEDNPVTKALNSDPKLREEVLKIREASRREALGGTVIGTGRGALPEGVNIVDGMSEGESRISSKLGDLLKRGSAVGK